MPHALRPFRLVGAATLVSLAAAALIVALGSWQILSSRQTTLEAAEESVRNLTRALAQHATRTIEAVDLALVEAQQHAEVGRDLSDIAATLRQQAGLLRQVRTIAILNADGDWIADTAKPHPPLNSADTAYFQWHRDHPEQIAHVEIPSGSTLADEAAIPLSRRIDGPGGSFAGVIRAGIEPDAFRSFYRTIAIGKQGTAALWDDAGRLLARYPAVPNSQEIKAAPLATASESGERFGVRRMTSPIDGIERIFAFEHLDSYPLMVTSSISVDEALSLWRHSTMLHAAALAAAAFGLSALGIGLERRRRGFERAQRALRREIEDANRYLRLAEGIAQVGHWRMDLVGGHLAWSDEVFRMHGLDQEIFVPTAESAIARYHPDDREELKRSINASLASGAPYTCRLRIVRPAGEVRHTLSQGRCETDPTTGRVIALFGVIADVTDLFEVERKLNHKSALLQTTLDTMNEGLIKMTRDGTVELTNRRLRELLRLPELEGDASPFKFTGPLSLGTREYRLPGGVVLEVSTVPAPDGAIVSTVRDVTARRQAETAARESQTRFRIITETTSDIVTQLDLNFERQYVSPACREILGFEPNELLGKSPSQSMHPDDATRVRAVAMQLIAGEVEGDRVSTTYRTLHKHGHYVWLETAMNLLRDGSTGLPIGLICSMRDVTERQRTSRHLLRAKAAAEQAARLKAEFIANISHELRTPLTGMLGVHDLLSNDQGLTSAQRRLVQLAKDSGQTLLTIVNDVLDLSKLEAGQCVLEAVPFNLRDLAATCRTLVSEGLGATGVEVVTAFADDAPEWVIGDPGRLRQILLNLLTNARKFTAHGRITIDVGGGAGLSTVSVTDTGIGIPEDKLPFLFKRFSQADSSTSRHYGGTGLGLAICKSLVELMGGRIGVESTLGQGSRFWFEIPLQRIDRENDAEVSGAGGGPIAVEKAFSRRILLAEDNLINQEIITAMLTSRGHAVTVVADGAGAVDIIRAGARFDLVLMDVQMPGMDGFEATAAIRRLPIDKSVPIVGLTANAMAEDVARCLAAGMDGHVAKPIEWPVLFAQIEASR